jgi:hypothetical protein
MLKPEPREWTTIEADSSEEAALELHDRNFRPGSKYGYSYTKWREDGFDMNETLYFAVVEIEGIGTQITRMISTGIYRRGGVRTNSGTQVLLEIAKNLGYEHDPKTLLEKWDLEEDYDYGR